MAAKKILIGNQKGGSGKTTTTANLAAVLAERGYQVLALDLDPQAQLVEVLASVDLLEYDEESGEVLSPTIADVLVVGPGRASHKLGDAIIHTPIPGIDLLPGSLDLEATINGFAVNYDQGMRALRNLLSEETFAAQGLDYDVVVIDTAPKIDNLLSAALKVVDYVLPVFGPESLQMSALSRFIGQVDLAQQDNARLQLLPALVNKANLDWAKSGSTQAFLAQADIKVYDDIIPMYRRIEGSSEYGPIVSARPNSREAAIVRQVVMQVVNDTIEKVA